MLHSQCHSELEFCWCEVNRKQDTAGAGRLKGEVERMVLHHFMCLACCVNRSND